MNHKIQSIIDSFQLSLSDEDNKQIISELGIKDLRKNPTSEEENHLNQVFQLIKEGQSIDIALSQFNQEKNEEDLEKIITEQANKAADIALLSVPNIAANEFDHLRSVFVRKFRERVEQQLRSPEYHQAFMEQIECLGESPKSLNSSTTNTPLLNSLPSNS